MSITLLPCSKFTRIWCTPFAKDLVSHPQQHSDSKGGRQEGKRSFPHPFHLYRFPTEKQKSKYFNAIILGSSLDKFILRIQVRATVGSYLRGRLGELWAGEQRMLVPAGLNSLLADAAADRTFIYAWECTLKQGPEKPAAWAGGNH